MNTCRIFHTLKGTVIGTVTAFLMALSPAARAEEASLKLLPESSGSTISRPWYFLLQAPSDSPVWIVAEKLDVSGPSKISGASVRIAPIQFQQWNRSRWQTMDTTYCTTPEHVILQPGEKVVIKVEAPETRQTWRLGVEIYSSAPAPGVKTTQVLSAPFPATIQEVRKPEAIADGEAKRWK